MNKIFECEYGTIYEMDEGYLGYAPPVFGGIDPLWKCTDENLLYAWGCHLWGSVKQQQKELSHDDTTTQSQVRRQKVAP